MAATTPERETRTLQRPLEIRAAGEGSATIGGYAAVFDSPTDICDGLWTEIVKPGAFRASLSADRDVLALYSHDLNRLLGRRSNGTLRLVEDDKGLSVEIDLPDTSDGRDVGVLVQRGDLKGMSFGFMVTRQEWDETTTPATRTIHEVDLYEVTVTADPAYADTEIGMRSLEHARAERRDHNKFAATARISARRARQAQAERRIH